MYLLGIFLHSGSKAVIKNLKENEWYGFYKDANYPDFTNFKDKTYHIYELLQNQNLKISVNCIVGKNGSGKTALLELVYRIINNISYDLLCKQNSDLRYAYGFNATLYFAIEDKEKKIEIYSFTSNNKENDSIIDISNKKIIYQNNKPTGFGVNREETILSKLFYTIVSNYSSYSFASKDYMPDEETLLVENKLFTDKVNGDWLYGIFNKNDGYKTPIVLTPYRDEFGNINNEKENALAKSRIISTLILLDKTGNGSSLIENYIPYQIKYKWNSNFKKENKDFRKLIKQINWLKQKQYSNEYVEFVRNSIKETWRSELGEIINRNEEINDICFEYLSYKLIKIIVTYEPFKKYRNGEKILLTDSKELKKEKITVQLKIIIHEIINESEIDHITLKLHQCIYFLTKSKKIIDETGVIELKDIIPYRNMQNIDSYFIVLPPAFFDIDLILNKKNNNNDLLYLSKMSSGERQFLYNLSYVIYHLKNISYKKSAPKYKNVLIIFDEIELYLHPDWQREFISKILFLIEKANLKNLESINIIMATHSPYLLSDVCYENILALEDGNNKLIKKQSFCANYYDLLENQFFLKYSIGEVARKKIEKIIHISKNDSCSEEDINFVFECGRIINDEIADPFLKNRINQIIQKISKKIENDKSFISR